MNVNRSVIRYMGKGLRCWVIATFAIGAALAFPAAPVTWAGGAAPCGEPFVFDGAAVNVIPIQYNFAGSNDQEPNIRDLLTETAQRLVWLIKVDTLLTANYGSLGVVAHLPYGEPEKCEPEQIQGRLLAGEGIRNFREGQAAVFLWGRIYQKESKIFLQSFMRSMRLAPDAIRVIPDRISLILKGNSGRTFTFYADLPGETIVFPPRRLFTSDLDIILDKFQSATKVYTEKRESAHYNVIPFQPETPIAYEVVEMHRDGWIKVKPYFGGSPGWIRLDPAVGSLLHLRLPELDFLNAMVGYQRVRQYHDAKIFRSPPRDALKRIRESLESYWENAGADAGEAVLAVGKKLLGTTLVLQSGWKDVSMLAEAGTLFEGAIKLARYDPTAFNLAALTEIGLCCKIKFAGNPQLVVDRLLGALSIQPNNADALANLESFYDYLLGDKVLLAQTRYKDKELIARRDNLHAARKLLGHLR